MSIKSIRAQIWNSPDKLELFGVIVGIVLLKPIFYYIGSSRFVQTNTSLFWNQIFYLTSLLLLLFILGVIIVLHIGSRFL